MNNFAGIILLSLRLGLAIILYLFLYWSIRIIWKDFLKTAQSEAQLDIPPIILSGPPDDQFEHTFTAEEIIIGRSPVCDFQITDETVSSKHVRVFFSHNQWWVEDFGSSNGSFLNEVLVKTAIVLTSGDQLRLGKIKIDVSFPG